jgi:hypothetical protein
MHEPVYVPWTIAEAASASNRVPLLGHSLFGIKAPAGWSAAQDIGIEAAVEDPFQTHVTADWETLTDQEGNAIVFTGVEEGKILEIDPLLTIGPRQIRFVALDGLGAAEVVAAARVGQAMLRRYS